MNAAPLVPDYFQLVIYGALVVLAIVAAAAWWEWRLNKRTREQIEDDAKAYRPRSADLHVGRAPDTDTDYRNTRPRHSRELQLRETAR